MKINFTMLDMLRGGGNRVLFEVGNRLQSRGHTVSFTTLGYPGLHKWFKLNVSSIIQVEEKFRLPTSRLLPDVLEMGLRSIGSLYSIDRITALAGAIPTDIDVNLATSSPTSFAVHRSQKGAPFYYVQHFEPLFPPDSYRRAMILETYDFDLSKIVVSRWLQRVIYEVCGDRAPIIPNGVDTQTFYPRQEERVDYPIISIIARSAPWKGTQDALAAMAIVAGKIKDATLFVAGEKYAFDSLRREYPGLRMKYVGAETDDDLARMYSASDIFVSSAWYEGFPLPPLEAMACGTPVVSTDNLGIRDYGVDGKNCVIVPPRNASILAEGIVKLLRDDSLSSELKVNGLGTAKEFSWEKSVDFLEQTFEKHINEPIETPNAKINRFLKTVT